MVRFYAFYRVHCASMRRMLVPCIFVLVAAIGCGQKSATNSVNQNSKPPAVETKSPEDQLYEQLHSGVFQLEAALDSIEESLKEAKGTKATGNAKGSLTDIVNDIDSAGSSLAEEVDDAPAKEAVAADMKSFEAKRKKLCDLVNDSLHDLRDARGIVDSLAEDGKDSPLENVGAKIDVAIDDLKGALDALGGKDEEPGDES